MPVLEATKVCKEYGIGAARVTALRDIDVQVETGEFLAIMGQSGSGKSTLLHVLGGIDPPSSGWVRLDGEDLGGLADTPRSLIRRRRIGFVFQKINLLPTLSAVENVALPLRIDGRAAGAARALAVAAMEQVGIAHRATHFPHEMSGGEQQRVAVARALVIRPAVILADEPTGSLDSINAQHILDLLRDCVRQGQTIVMVTHDADLARQANRVVVMHDGKIVDGEEGSDAGSMSAGSPRQELGP